MYDHMYICNIIHNPSIAADYSAVELIRIRTSTNTNGDHDGGDRVKPPGNATFKRVQSTPHDLVDLISPSAEKDNRLKSETLIIYLLLINKVRILKKMTFLREKRRD